MSVTLGGRVFDGSRPLVMGILNVTPDSFFDGGNYESATAAVERAMAMIGEGADIIDIGGESSRPGAEPVSYDDEIRRLMPVIETVAARTCVPISVDTYKARIAREALEAGACIVNDISALGFDADMTGVIRDSGASVILMHMLGEPRTMQKDPRYNDPVNDILGFLHLRIEAAIAGGIPRDRIIVDPGIGFGKTLDHNIALIRDIGRFHETGCPVCVGVSRKSMFGMLTGAQPVDRIWGTAAVTALCVAAGVEIHRVHDVREMRQVCDTAAAFRTVSPSTIRG